MQYDTSAIKKFLLSAIVIFSVSAYALRQRGLLFVEDGEDDVRVQPATSTLSVNNGANTKTSTTATPTNTTTAPKSGNTTSTNTTPLGSGMGMMQHYTDGTYTSSTADAYYGNVQITVTITNGAIIDVAFLAYPNLHGTSRYINQQAMPLLTQEAIKAQSANVNIVTGATFTSRAFRKAMESALAKAS